MCFLPQAPEGENQPSTEVDLFISTEKIMVLNTDLKVSAARNSQNRLLISGSGILHFENLLCITYFELATRLVPVRPSPLRKFLHQRPFLPRSFRLHNLRAEWVCH